MLNQPNHPDCLEISWFYGSFGKTPLAKSGNGLEGATEGGRWKETIEGVAEVVHVRDE